MAASATSYAPAWAQEAQLGGRLDTTGATRTGGAVQLPALPSAGGLAIGKALSRLQPESRATTRGAAETKVYQQASPAVVLIVSKDSLGSGALIAPDGKIITNLHVVGDADEVGVVFKPAIEGAAVSKADVRRAKVVRRDEVTDLALIEVEEVPAGVKPLAIGNSTTVQVGADVHAIGHPTGEAWTYTRGIVSQIRRAYAWQAEDKVQHEATVIQTQTPINPGNSGGPLLDANLAIVGINSFKGEGEGMNYAVSAEDVKTFLARADDRVAHKTQTAAETCEPAKVSEKRSDKPKGVSALIDTDCDDKADALLITPDSKRDPVVLAMDEDGDGKFDVMYFDDKHDGDFDEALYDTDGDDKPDLKGFFRNGEDEPYRWEKM
ncbi:S1C family serine protease [Phenylobacterium sp.]|uniref:S1C family serine protease n=1 Tax=Phenylobacterium sp. TaxID=1871053 RepID=UPI003783A934